MAIKVEPTSTPKRLLCLLVSIFAIFLSIDTASGQLTTTAVDDFASGNYTAGTGWTGPWVDEESGATAATNGNLRVESSRLRMYQAISGGGGLYREFSVTQSTFTTRTLTFNFAGNTGNDSAGPSDFLIVEFSSNGGASYTTLASLHRNLATTVSSGTINLPGITGPGNYRVRFRNSDGAQSSEDYYVDDVTITVTGTVTATTDFGDWNGSGAATTTTSSTVNNNLRLGASVDAEFSVTPNVTATADGTDEDGVSLPSTLIAGSVSSVTAQYTNTTGSNAFINAWIDFNRNGSFADSGEQVATNLSAIAGVTNGTVGFAFTVPAGASPGSTGVRIRLTSTSGPGATGASGVGEVEDYLTNLAAAGAAGASPMQDYNVIVRNNLDVLTAVEGRIMVRNIINTNSATFAMKLPDYASTAQTVQIQTSVASGSALNLTYGSLYAPNAVALNGRTINYNGGGTFQTTPAPNFTTVFGGIVTASASYAAIPANNTITIPGSPAGLTLSVTSLDANGVAIFSIDGNTLLNNSNVQQIDINLNGFTPSAILINCTGTSINYTGSGNFVGNFLDGLLRPKILWNFPAATSLTLGKSIYGSVLAPNATVDATAGAIEGSVACNNLTSNIAVRLPVFQGGIVIPSTTDFGDYTGFSSASQTANAAIRIGTLATDAEAANPANGTATGDDNTGDDEDLTMPVFTVGSATTLSIPVSVTPASLVGSTSRINVFADWNGDGDVADTNETLAVQSVISSGTRNFSLTPPVGTTAGTKYLRIRFTEGSTAPTFSGASALKGEVEDYSVTVNTGASADFGDYSGFSTASSTMNNNLRIGSLVDSEASITGNIAATGDDEGTNNDEEGVTLPAILTQGAASSMSVRVTNSIGSVGYLNAWIDFNGNGVLTDAGEQVATNTNIATGTNNVAQTINFTVPATATPGTVGVRVRLTSTSGPGATGASGTGEVEDYVTTIGCASVRMSPALLATAPDQAASTPFTWSNVASSGVNVSLTWEDVDAGFVSHGFRGYNMGDPDYGNVGVFVGDDPTFAFTGDSRFTFNFSQPVTEVIIHYTWLSNGYGAEELTNWTATGSGTTIITHTELGAHPDVGGGWSNLANVLPGRSHWNGSKIYCDSGIHDGVGTIRISTTGSMNSLAFTLDAISGNNAGFVIREVTFCPAPSLDFGDYTGFSSASQTANAAIRIGTLATDAEAANPANGTATGDDNTGDDEDLTMPVFTVGSATTLSIPVSVTPASLVGSTSRINVFADWNGDGDVSDTNESLAVQSVISSGTRSFSLTPPVGTTPGTKYLRIRFTEGSTAPTFSGLSSLKGEVEDYAVTVNATGATLDFGDWNGGGAATTTTSSSLNSNLRMGATVDTEASVTPNAAATADGADEDGVWFAPSVTVGSYAQLSVKATNNTGSTAYLHAWIDFDNNGTFDVGEQVAANHPVPNGSNGYDPAGLNVSNSAYQYFRLQYLVPATASVGTSRGVRVRLTNVLNTPATGASGSGEIEDYTVAFTATAPCYHFRFGDTNGDKWIDPTSEMTPLPNNTPIYWDQNNDLGTIRELDMTYSPSSKLFNFDCTVAQVNASGVVADSLWFMLDTGPLGMPNVQRYAMVYIDGFNRSAPQVMVYVENATSHSGSWSSPGHLLLSTAPNGPNASDVKVLSVTEDATAKTSRFRLTLDTTRINDRTIWPAAYTLDADWRGIEMRSTAGLWLTISDHTAAPTYNATTGKLTAMNYNSSGSSVNIDVQPMGHQPILTESCPLDFGDHFFPASSSASQTASTAIKIGTAATDAEGDYTDTGAALDDTTGTDDEDLTMPAFTVGTATTLAVPMTITAASLSGGTARVNVFVDWNGDNDVLDTNETLTVLTVSASGTFNFSLTPPAGTTAGTKYLRIRAAEGATHPGFSGASTLKGEVEDYAVTVNTGAPLDYSDATGYTAATATQTAGTPKFGALVDYEASQPANDNTTGADEDGVYVVTQALQGTELYVNYDANTNAQAYVNIWVDWNRNGSFGDAGEQVVINQSHTTRATGTLKIPVPTTATPGASWIRARISSASGAAATGSTADGEVEDHPVTITDRIVVSGTIWQDTNGNGQREVGEPLLPNLAVAGLNAVYDSVTTTDALGAYQLTISPGSFNVRVTAGAIPSYTSSPRDAGSDTTDSDFPVASGLDFWSDGITVTAASPDMTLDLGLIPAANFRIHEAIGGNGWGNYSSSGTLPKFYDPTNTLVRAIVRVGFHAPRDVYFENTAATTSIADLSGTISVTANFPSYTATWSRVAGLPASRPTQAVADGVLAFNPAAGFTYAGNYDTFDSGGMTQWSLTTEAELSPYLGVSGSTFNVPVSTNHVQNWIGATTYNAKVDLKVLAPVAVAYEYASADWGDLADTTAATGAGNYQTLRANSGPWHLIVTGLRLGAAVDAEPDGLQSNNADGDGADDDSVAIWPTFTPGSTATVAVIVQNTGAAATLFGFVDFNNDGDFLDAGEPLSTVAVATSATSVNLSVPVPAGAVTGTPLGFRLRLSRDAGVTSLGKANNGEVEDHRITVSAPITDDYGDYSGFASASQAANGAIRIGTLATDAEAADPSDGNATGDDNVGDDEDLTMPAFTVGASTTLSIPVTITPASLSGSTSRINVFVDWNDDGDVVDAGETQTAQSVISSGARNFSLTPPIGTTPGTKYLRIRFTEGNTAPAFSGISALKGEVEDYAISVTGSATVSVGNLVWIDANSNGIKDASELGITGATVRLYSLGIDDAIGGIGANADVQVGATFTTLSDGAYNFTGLAPGKYFVRVTPPAGNWSQTLMGGRVDNDIDNNSDAGRNLNYPDSFISAVFTLNAGTEPAAAVDGDDTNGNATIDFGLRNCIVIDPYIDPIGGAGFVSNTVVGTTVSNTDNTISTTYGPRMVSVEALVAGSSIVAEIIDGSLEHNHSATARSKLTVKYGDQSTAPLNKDLAALGNAFEMGMWFNDLFGNTVTWTATVWSGAGSATSSGSVTANGLWTIPFSGFGVINWTDIDAIEISFVPTTNGIDLGFQSLGICGPAYVPTSDFGDYSGFASAAQSANSAIRIGTLATDGEAADPSNGTATGDDNVGDDEDLTMPAFTVGAATTLSIPVTITPASLSGGTSRINVFVDWNDDGDVADAGETQTAQSVVSSGTRSFSLTPPIGTTPGTKYLRIRFTEGSTAPTFSGVSALKGEVEDYAVNVDPAGSFTIGNLVWNDANQDGIKDATETGINGVAVQLRQGASLIATTTTSGGGLYSFTAPAGSNYFVRLPSPPAATPYVSGRQDATDNGIDGVNRGRQPGGPGTQIDSHTFDLTVLGEPGSAGTTSAEDTIDFALRAVPNPATLVEYLFESASPVTPVNADVKNSCVTSTSEFQPSYTNINFNVGAGEDGPLRPGVNSRWIKDFSLTYNTALENTRTSLTPTNLTAHALYTFHSGAVGTIGNFYGDFCPDAQGSKSVRVFLTWMDGAVYRTAWTNTNVLTPSSWTTVDAAFVNGSALPTGAGLGGKTFLLEIFVWGNTGVTPAVSIDNLLLGGSCSIVTDDFGDYGGFASAAQSANSAIRIGTLATDGEAADPSNGTATGDDNVGDDEDLTMPAFTVGASTTLSIPVTITPASLSGGTSRINVFVDWNDDGDVADTGETQTAQSVVSSGTRSFSLTPPVGTTPGTKYLRIRFTEGSTAPTFSGVSALKGEVEDYALNVVAPPAVDFGDHLFSGTSSASQFASVDIRIGTNATDAELADPSDANANRDDTTGSNDEDLIMPLFLEGTATTLSIPVTLDAAQLVNSQARVALFADWNANGTIDTGESSAPVTISASGNVAFVLTPPAGSAGTRFLRLRITESTTTPTFSGASALKGEVEDYAISVSPSSCGAVAKGTTAVIKL